jgi:hypothetical protein
VAASTLLDGGGFGASYSIVAGGLVEFSLGRTSLPQLLVRRLRLEDDDLVEQSCAQRLLLLARWRRLEYDELVSCPSAAPPPPPSRSTMA